MHWLRNLTELYSLMNPTTIIYLGILAMAPSLALMIYIYWKDKFDKEPLKELALTFILGALSAVPVIVTGHLLKLFGFDESSKSLLWSLVSMFCVVGFVEEFYKFLAVYVYAYRHKAFNEPFDGITYGVMAAMGFATLENLLYVFLDDQPETVAWMRMFTAVPAHAFFGVISGYFIGLQRTKNLRGLAIQGVLLAAVLHTCYNFFLTHSYIPGLILGALASLLIGYRFSMTAIKKHNALKTNP